MKNIQSDQDEYFTIMRLHRDDLQEFIPEEKRKNISNSSMQDLADKLGKALMEGFWISLKVLVTETNVLDD